MREFKWYPFLLCMRVLRKGSWAVIVPDFFLPQIPFAVLRGPNQNHKNKKTANIPHHHTASTSEALTSITSARAQQHEHYRGTTAARTQHHKHNSTSTTARAPSKHDNSTSTTARALSKHDNSTSTIARVLSKQHNSTSAIEARQQHEHYSRSAISAHSIALIRLRSFD